jgi:hypothetical protein
LQIYSNCLLEGKEAWCPTVVFSGLILKYMQEDENFCALCLFYFLSLSISWYVLKFWFLILSLTVSFHPLNKTNLATDFPQGDSKYFVAVVNIYKEQQTSKQKLYKYS